MAQHYSNPNRAEDRYSLPDVETFRAKHADCPFCTSTIVQDGCGEWHCDSCNDGRRNQGVTPADVQTGWFYWFCFPGCMPDSEPVGPFATEAEALADARDGMIDGSDSD